MNITRENLDNLDLCIKMEVVSDDYEEKVSKTLKDYRRKASIPGFRKGMAPMGMIERQYRPAVVADTVQELLGQNLYKYLEDEKLDILGSPLSNEEKTGTPDFEHGKEFTFYFDAALKPEVNIDWTKVDVSLCSIKMDDADIDKQVTEVTRRHGKFETPEILAEGDYVYGKAEEVTKKGEPKVGGVSTFCSFELKDFQDPEQMAAFIGKKAEDVVIFSAPKVFTTEQIAQHFHLDEEKAKKFKSDVRLTISGCSRITPAELDEKLFEKVFPGKDIKDLEAFKKALSEQLDKANDEQCQILYVNQVRKQLLDNFDAQLPEAFLKRWIASRGEKDMTPEQVEADWIEKYLPSIKWELIDAALVKIQPIEPTPNEVVDYVKDILRTNDVRKEGEDDKAAEERLEQAARSIAQERENVRQIYDTLYVQKTFALLKSQLKPRAKKVTKEQFAERCK